MKQLVILLVLLLGLTLFTACTGNKEVSEGNQAGGKVKKLTAAEAKTMIDSDKEIVLVDVRTEEEYAEQHIAGSILIPDYNIQSLAESKLPNKDATILIYCRSGRRSALAADILVNMGYTKVYDFGGIIDWKYDTVSEK